MLIVVLFAMLLSVTSISANEVTYKEGDSDEQIIEMKEKLNAIGFSGIQETSYFGSYTAKKVKEFQNYYGLDATGKANSSTLNKINEVYNSPYQEGKSHNNLSDIKRKLNTMGYGTIKVTNYFGSFTTKKVKEFQSDHGLVVNGIIDEVTLAKINSQSSPPYRQGDRHTAIADFKRDLNRIGFNGIKVTTYFGSYTTTKVKEFQQYYGLKADGIVGESTLDKMEEILNSPYQEGKSHNNLSDIKKKLNALGYGKIIVTDYFGSFTTKKVKEFQRDHGLAVNGLIDEVTLTEINSQASPPYQQGDRHTTIADFKRDLNRIGFNGILVTTYFGSYTTTKVKEFQQYYGLKADGVVGESTLDKMDEVVNSPYREGKSHNNLSDIKKKLNALGYGKIIVTDYFGSFTTKKVKEFQRDHGLVVNGIIDEVTLAEINSQASPPYREGDRHTVIADFKRDLNKVGFGQIMVTTYFGSFTTKKVKEFQQYYGLKTDGVVGQSTLDKIKEVANSPYQEGKSHSNLSNIKENLNHIGYGTIQVTNYFGSFTTKKVKAFQRDHGLVVNGIIDEVTLAKINSQASPPYREGDRHPDIALMKRNLNLLGFDGILESDYFGSFTKKRLIEFQKKYGLTANGVADQTTLNKLNDLVQSLVTYTNYDKTFSSFVDSLMTKTPKANGTGTVAAGRNLVEYYANPSNFPSDTNAYLQFLLLSQSANINVKEINEKVLQGKGTLAGTAEAFAEAGRRYNLNEVYLIAHSLHETGNGSSTLAQGQKYNGETVYNMFGTAAYDGSANSSGAKYAYEQGWFSPKEAIIGGAKFIAERFVKNGQDTLYKMKWNPGSTGPGHYATHVSWAIHQTSRMANILNSISTFNYVYEVPQFRDQPGYSGANPPHNLIEYPSGIKGTTTDRVNFRAQPNTNNGTKVYETLDNNQTIDIIGKDGYGWYRAKVNGRSGWVHGDYVTVKNLIEVTASGLNVRTSPNGSLVGQVNRGQHLVGILDSNARLITDNEWYHIKYNGANRWVSSGSSGQYLKIIK
ncbi:peptidoglycan-binding protein [Gracilibacillus salitolerans]|nr:peptidoglycan-binding protein [Gracilibacillus salitolerans]